MRTRLLPCLVVACGLVWQAALPPAVRADDRCRIVAEISVEAVKQGAMLVCLRTGHPLACSVATAVNDAATSGVLKRGAEAGCNWVVEKIDSKIRIKVSGDKNAADKIRESQKDLQKIKEIKLIEKLR